jgi:hypothetical protein
MTTVVNTAVVRELAPRLPAVLPARPLAAALGGIAVLVTLTASVADGTTGAAWTLRGTALFLAAAAAFALDDPAADVLAPSPTTLAARRLVRLTVVGAVSAGTWLAVAAYLSVRGTSVSLAALGVESLGVVAAAVAAAAVLAARGTPTPGLLVAPAVPVIVLATAQIPRRWALLGDPTQWSDASTRWLVVVALAAAVVVRTSRDPASPPRRLRP